MAVLVVQRLRGPVGGTLKVGAGLARGAAAEVRSLAAGVTRAAWDRAAPRAVDALVPHLVASVVPRIVDGIMPHLEKAVVPRLVESTLPLLRTRVLPVLIQELTDDPLLRTLLLEQSRSLAGKAADRLRSGTAQADDRVEDLFHGLLHRHRER